MKLRFVKYNKQLNLCFCGSMIDTQHILDCSVYNHIFEDVAKTVHSEASIIRSLMSIKFLESISETNLLLYLRIFIPIEQSLTLKLIDFFKLEMKKDTRKTLIHNILEADLESVWLA